MEEGAPPRSERREEQGQAATRQLQWVSGRRGRERSCVLQINQGMRRGRAAAPPRSRCALRTAHCVRTSLKPRSIHRCNRRRRRRRCHPTELAPPRPPAEAARLSPPSSQPPPPRPLRPRAGAPLPHGSSPPWPRPPTAAARPRVRVRPRPRLPRARAPRLRPLSAPHEAQPPPSRREPYPPAILHRNSVMSVRRLHGARHDVSFYVTLRSPATRAAGGRCRAGCATGAPSARAGGREPLDTRRRP